MATESEVSTRLDAFIIEWSALLTELQTQIGDEYRCTWDDESDAPSMDVTISVDDDVTEWSYQTGDNSYSGGCYSHPHWAVLGLYRDSDCKDLAEEAANQLADLIEWDSGPTDDDYVISDCGPLGSLYQVSNLSGTWSEWIDVIAAIRADMDHQHYWPNVWRCSDHGNLSLIDISKE